MISDSVESEISDVISNYTLSPVVGSRHTNLMLKQFPFSEKLLKIPPVSTAQKNEVFH